MQLANREHIAHGCTKSAARRRALGSPDYRALLDSQISMANAALSSALVSITPHATCRSHSARSRLCSNLVGGGVRSGLKVRMSCPARLASAAYPPCFALRLR